MDGEKAKGLSAGLIVAVVIALAIVAAFAFKLIDIDQTKQTRLPEVKTEGGQMPAFDVKTADVNVGTAKTTIEVPKIETKKTSVDLPTVSVEKAK
jgi:hypothetical protein